MNLLPVQLVAWLLGRARLVVLALCLGVMASALAVAYSAYLTRSGYTSLHTLGKTRDELQVEYERLLLEFSAHADYTRVDSLAREELRMVAPAPSRTVVLQ